MIDLHRLMNPTEEEREGIRAQMDQYARESRSRFHVAVEGGRRLMESIVVAPEDVRTALLEKDQAMVGVFAEDVINLRRTHPDLTDTEINDLVQSRAQQTDLSEFDTAWAAEQAEISALLLRTDGEGEAAYLFPIDLPVLD